LHTVLLAINPTFAASFFSENMLDKRRAEKRNPYTSASLTGKLSILLKL
jgi:hypothetical protein